MTHFDPQAQPVEEFDERIDRLGREYSDEELLIELRRRGRLARVTVENVAPERFVSEGIPIEYQIERAWREFAQEATRLHVGGKAPTGAKVERVRGDGVAMSPLEQGRRVSFAVNYVVDRK